MDNFFEKAAKTGWLGTRAKTAADTKTADWSTKEEPKPQQPNSQLEAMKRRQAKFGL